MTRGIAALNRITMRIVITIEYNAKANKPEMGLSSVILRGTDFLRLKFLTHLGEKLEFVEDHVDHPRPQVPLGHLEPLETLRPSVTGFAAKRSTCNTIFLLAQTSTQ
jgi:hypothetical protein